MPPASAALTSSRVIRPFSPLPLIALRSRSSSRARRRTAGPARTPAKSGLAGAGPAGAAEGGGAAGAAAAGAGAADGGAAGGGGAAGCASLAGAGAALPASADSSRAISLPIDSLSPILAITSTTLPATGDGTSIVALSDSSVTSDWSTLTSSPGFTSTSITGTSLKSPMSGTLTSIFATGAVSLRAERVGCLSVLATAQDRRRFPRPRPEGASPKATRLEGHSSARPRRNLERPSRRPLCGLLRTR